MFDRDDKQLLLQSPAFLYGLEDFTLYLSQFGRAQLFGKPVAEWCEEFRVGEDSYSTDRDAEAALSDKYADTGAKIQRFVACRLEGEDNIRELPMAEFHRTVKYMLVPQVLVHRRGGAELRFFRDGISVGLSGSRHIRNSSHGSATDKLSRQEGFDCLAAGSEWGRYHNISRMACSRGSCGSSVGVG